MADKGDVWRELRELRKRVEALEYTRDADEPQHHFCQSCMWFNDCLCTLHGYGVASSSPACTQWTPT